MNEMRLLRKVLINDWIDVKAMVSPKVPHILLDVVFITAEGGIRLTGKAHSLRNEPEEAFSLAIYEHDRGCWWSKPDGSPSDWKPRNLRDEWASQSLQSMLALPREARFYSDPRLNDRKLSAECALDNCTAIEFSKGAAGGKKRIVFAASEAYPCEIEMGTTPDSCGLLLSGLDAMAMSIK